MNYISGRCFQLHGRFTYGQVERMVAQYETYRQRIYSEDYVDVVAQSAQKIPMTPTLARQSAICTRENEWCETTADCCPGNLACVPADGDDSARMKKKYRRSSSLRDQLMNHKRCLPYEQKDEQKHEWRFFG